MPAKKTQGFPLFDENSRTKRELIVYIHQIPNRIDSSNLHIPSLPLFNSFSTSFLHFCRKKNLCFSEPQNLSVSTDSINQNTQVTFPMKKKFRTPGRHAETKSVRHQGAKESASVKTPWGWVFFSSQAHG